MHKPEGAAEITTDETEDAEPQNIHCEYRADACKYADSLIVNWMPLKRQDSREED